MASNLFKGYIEAGDKSFVRYIQHQKDKYGYGEDIDKYKLVTLALNKYENLCTQGQEIGETVRRIKNHVRICQSRKMNEANL